MTGRSTPAASPSSASSSSLRLGPRDPSRQSGPSTVPPPEPPRRFRSLASRLVALGVLQLVLLFVIGAVLVVVAGPREEARPRDVLDPAALRRLEGATDDETLARLLSPYRERRIEISIYDANKALVARNVQPALAIPERPPHGHHDHPDRDDHDARVDEGPPEGGPPDDHGPPREHGPHGDHGGPADHPPPNFADMPGQPRQPPMFLSGFNVHGNAGWLIARGTFGQPAGLTLPIVTLIASFLILIASALLTARWIVRPIDRLSRTARALGTGDLTARSQLARSDEIGELGHRMDEMADRLSGLIVAERELLANVAHELRTPLSRIGVALDLASEGDSDAARASLSEIAVDVSELETIVNDILTATRFEVGASGGLPLRLAHVTPASIAEAAASRMRTRHPNRPFELVVAPELPAVHVDPMLLRRVVDNLLENAHKYFFDPDAPITLTVGARGDRVVFEVSDKGIGISAADLPRVFTAFFRGDKSRSRETGGVGLGLTLAKRIVEAHGGTIAVESTPSVGTTVRFVVPADAA